MHDLRHTFASLRLAHGSNFEMIGQLLGHKSALTTRRHAKLIEDRALEEVDDEVDDNGAAVERLSKFE